MTEYRWKRARYPDGHGSNFLSIGIVGLVIAGLLGLGSYLLLESYQPVGWLVLYGAGALFLPSILFVMFGCLIEEIRRMAFENALRAGEVEIVEAKDASTRSETAPSGDAA